MFAGLGVADDVVLGLIGFRLLLPLFALAHELGHAAVALLRTSGPVRVCVGADPGRLRLDLGRLELHVTPTLSTRGPVGMTWGSGTLGVWSFAAYTLAGPAASGLVSIICILAGLWTGFGPAIGTGGVALFYSVLALVPHTAAGHRSDGGRFLDALRAQASSRNARSVS